MAVIVSGMQIPDNCNVRSCDFCNMDEEERAYCINGEEVTEYADICKKHPACPLKSVDDMIPLSVIEDIKAELHEISEETVSKADIDAIDRCIKVIDRHISGKENNG